jgi:hypothetical protein
MNKINGKEVNTAPDESILASTPDLTLPDDFSSIEEQVKGELETEKPAKKPSINPDAPLDPETPDTPPTPVIPLSIDEFEPDQFPEISERTIEQVSDRPPDRVTPSIQPEPSIDPDDNGPTISPGI